MIISTPSLTRLPLGDPENLTLIHTNQATSYFRYTIIMNLILLHFFYHFTFLPCQSFSILYNDSYPISCQLLSKNSSKSEAYSLYLNFLEWVISPITRPLPRDHWLRAMWLQHPHQCQAHGWEVSRPAIAEALWCQPSARLHSHTLQF